MCGCLKAESRALWTDRFLVTGGTGVGTLDLTFARMVNVDSTDIGSGAATVWFNGYPQGSYSGSGTMTLSRGFTFGQSFVWPTTGIEATATIAHAGSCVVTSSLTLVGAAVRDASGQPVAHFLIGRDSDERYDYGGSDALGPFPPERLYVDASSPGGGDGTSWQSPLENLRDAIDLAAARLVSGEMEIWVREGVYLPDQGFSATPGDRAASFGVRRGLSILGGFAGDETQADERDPEQHPTVLSGQLNDLDPPSELRSFHVVTALAGGFPTHAALLSGLTIERGNAQQSGNGSFRGGGVLLWTGDLELSDCVIRDNRAGRGGGIAVLEQRHARITRCVFEGNRAEGVTGPRGGALYALNSTLDVEACQFRSNLAPDGGGAIALEGSSAAEVVSTVFTENFSNTSVGGCGGGAVWSANSHLVVTGCLFVRNRGRDGGAIYTRLAPEGGATVRSSTFVGNTFPAGSGNGSALCVFESSSGGPALVQNSILWGNPGVVPIVVNPPTNLTVEWSNVEGGWQGTGNLSVDPLFFQPSQDDFRLAGTSPCIDEGYDAFVPSELTLDLAGAPRLVDACGPDTGELVDIGTYEAQGVTRYGTAKVNSLGCVPYMSTLGTPSVSGGQPFLVRASNVLSGRPGRLFFGLNGPAATPFQGGTLLVKPSISRTPVQVATGPVSPVDCTGQYSYDFNALIAAGTHPGLIPGARVCAQYYSRDEGFAPPNNVGLTDAVEFAICP